MDLVMQYIKATTTLYGVVSMQKIVEIYNEQNDDAIILDNLKDYSVEALEKEHVYAEGTTISVFVPLQILLSC